MPSVPESELQSNCLGSTTHLELEDGSHLMSVKLGDGSCLLNRVDDWSYFILEGAGS